MSKIQSFEDLVVWQRGIDLVKQVYKLSSAGSLARDFGLRDQIRRAAVSIPTNIAEGFERASRKEYLLFLNIAKALQENFEVSYELRMKSAISIDLLTMSCITTY